MLENTGAIAGLLAIAGAVGMFWNHIKGFFDSVYSLFVCQVSIEDKYAAYYQLNAFAAKKLKPINKSRKLVRLQDVFVGDSKNKNQIGCEIINEGFNFYWYGWLPILIYSSQGKDDKVYGSYTVHYLRFTLNGDVLVNEILQNFINECDKTKELDRNSVIHVYGSGIKTDKAEAVSNFRAFNDTVLIGIPIGYSDDQISMFSKSYENDNYYVSKEFQEILKDVKFWKNNKEWYQLRGIPWKRGYVFYGKPGCGKSTGVKQIAKALNLPVYVFDVLSLTNKEFRTNWSRLKLVTPCIVLFEDFDIVFNGRENLGKNLTSESVTFDTFLNSIDGIDGSDGIITCITTNNIDVLDTALGGKFGGDNGLRPGRINKVVCMRELDEEGCLYICNKILPEYKEFWGDIINESLNKKETTAQFQERCIVFAINKLYNIGE